MASGILTIKDLLEFVSYCAVILGVPVALVQYFLATRKEQKDREYGTYDELDDRYLAYQQLCVEHPDLDVWDLSDGGTRRELTAKEHKQELQLFTILFAIFERAFLMYSDMSTDLKKAQWHGWEDYLASYCKRENFRHAWARSGTTFDEKFQTYMQRALASNQCAPAQVAE
jgi:hypothetical protein